MVRVLNSFKVRSKDKLLDYRLGEKLNLTKIKIFFQKKYSIKRLWNGTRHVLGILTKDHIDYFLKLSTSEGISVVTENEYDWNNFFNQYFPLSAHFSVPKNYDSGVYRKKYYYLITDYFNGEIICDLNGGANDLTTFIEDVILLSELIQQMPSIKFSTGQCEVGDFKQKFIDKVNKWFSDIPIDIRKEFKIGILLKIVEDGVNELTSRPRHGDFTPWHMIKLKDLGLGLIDGEHAKPDGVEGYDICYLIQRVFSALKNPIVARNIYFQLLAKRYEKNKLKTVLAARAIGGFLDESLIEKSEYNFANKFKDWVIKLN